MKHKGLSRPRSYLVVVRSAVVHVASRTPSHLQRVTATQIVWFSRRSLARLFDRSFVCSFVHWWGSVFGIILSNSHIHTYISFWERYSKWNRQPALLPDHRPSLVTLPTTTTTITTTTITTSIMTIMSLWIRWHLSLLVDHHMPLILYWKQKRQCQGTWMTTVTTTTTTTK